jgi:hypothetical protein
MDETKQRIKDYIVELYSEMDEVDELDFLIAEALDRSIVYMGREDSDTPFPEILERPIARAIISNYKNVQSLFDSEFVVGRVKDHGQELTFSEKLQDFFMTESDTVLFGSFSNLLDNYRLARGHKPDAKE